METIEIKLREHRFTLPAYSTVLDAFIKCSLIDIKTKDDYSSNPVVGALVNGEAYPLGKRLTLSSSIEPIYLCDTLGRRIYRHSICFLLSFAAWLLYPERNLVIGHSLGDGYYFYFDDDLPITDEETEKIKDKMKEIVSSSLDITYKALSGEETIASFRRLDKENTVMLLSSQNDAVSYVYSLGSYMQLSYEPLVSNTAVLSIYELRRYAGKGLLLRYPVSSSINTIVKMRDNPLLFSVFEEYRKWGRILSVRSVGEMNRVIINGRAGEYIKLSEDLHRRKIASISDDIASRGTRIVFVAGPSSSGKTTFAKRLCEELKLLGFEPFKISLDDYYNPPSMAPKDENGKPDLERLEALNVALIDHDMKALLEGEEVLLPSYDFNTHITTFSSLPVKMKEKTIVVVEGIHALNEEITSSLESRYIYKVYISALTQLNLDDSNRVSTSDNRLLRRLVRDYRSRSMSAESTLNMWPSVTRGETRHIFPHQNNADVMFNSALDYEIAVLSPYVVPLLRSVKREEGEAYALSRRLLAFLENVYPVSSIYVPSDSLLREFIGQSDYE